MLAIRHTISGNHRKMNSLFGRQSALQHFYAMAQTNFFILTYKIRSTGKLHLTQIDHVVIPKNQQVNLHAFLFLISLHTPSRNRRFDASNLKSTLDLLYMLPTNLLKSHPMPSLHDVRSHMVIGKSCIRCISLHIFQPKEAEIIHQLIAFNILRLTKRIISHNKITLHQSCKRIR